MLEILFHGVRGSLPAPGPLTAGVGGHTSAVEVRAEGQSVLLDAGTGLAAVGDRVLAAGTRETTILLSHVHWDHIQGLPFFTPIYVPGQTVTVASGWNGVMPLETVLRRQLAAPVFPVAFDDVAAQLKARDLVAGRPLEIGPLKITFARLNHPDPVYGYRIEAGGRSIVYATDTEHYACVDPTLAKLARGADLLVYDAQYTPEEYPTKVGWGHSTYEAGCALARAAGVGQLVLFHHDPRRTDAQVEAIEARARLLFPDVIAAREGMVLAAGARAATEAA